MFVLLMSVFSAFVFNQELTPDQIAMVRQAVDSGNSSYTDTETADDDIKEVIKPSEAIKDSNLDTQGKKYGYDFFSTIATSISARGDLPLPNDYKISLRDQVTIILTSSRA